MVALPIALKWMYSTFSQYELAFHNSWLFRCMCLLAGINLLSCQWNSCVCALPSRRLCADCWPHFCDSAFGPATLTVDTISRVFVSLAHGPQLLFCCRDIDEAFSTAANQKPFVNKDLCTRKSFKRTLIRVRDKRLALAWQLKMWGRFSGELEHYSTHTTTRLLPC